MLRLKTPEGTVTLRERPDGEYLLTVRRNMRENSHCTTHYVFAADNLDGLANVSNAIKSGDMAFFMG